MNSTYGLSAENMLMSLPSVLKNSPKMFAIAQSIAQLLEKRTEEINRIKIFTDIDSLPESVLDILAHDFKVDWYDGNYSVETKREIIKSCFEVHRQLGTKGAFLEALRSIHPNSDIEEWFEYGGNPHYFRIILDVTNQNEPINHTGLINSVEPFKRLTARLEPTPITYKLSTKIKIKACAVRAQEVISESGTYPTERFKHAFER